MDKIRVGIAGTGYTVGIAGMHLNGYASQRDNCELVALYDVIPGRAAQWAMENSLKNIKICGSFDELLEQVDAVSLCVPNCEHIPLLKKAFASNKHVLCEKPISIDAISAREVVQSEPRDRIHMVGFSYRGIPALRYAKQLIDSNRLGKIFTYRETLGGCRIANPNVKLEWRMQHKMSGTGALADFGCHMIDLCDWLLHDSQGAMCQVNGMCTRSIEQREDIETGKMNPVSNDDSASFTMKLESGTLASFVASRLGVLRHTLEIYSEGGMLLFCDDRPNELEVWFKATDVGYGPDKPEVIRVPQVLITEPWQNAEFAEFIDCIKTGRAPERSLKRGLYIQTLVDAAEKACETGETIAIPN
ncbi:MAG: Gfo/Idh/MocA family oxidoreductase [Clostridia bacterium]